MRNILVTGGLGFIGSCFVIDQINKGNKVVNLDKITYAANLENDILVRNNPNYHFVKGDIADYALVLSLLEKFNIDNIVNFAAESHVDNSIKAAEVFITTNINGTFYLLEAARKYYDILSEEKKSQFRFLHVSTDEVYGSLKEGEAAFTENNPYRPNSPYSASKAASDHLVRAWGETYKLPTIITNCSNNFGPRQHFEKFIPTVILSALKGKEIPVYGNGKNIRDWIYVQDHCHGIDLALHKGQIGQTYCFGGECEMRNIDLAEKLCEILDQIKPRSDGISYKTQIKYVNDRAGHDYRYAINNGKAKEQLGYNIAKKDRFKETVEFYLE